VTVGPILMTFAVAERVNLDRVAHVRRRWGD